MTWRRTIETLAAVAALVAGCSGGMQGGTTMMEKKSLYDRLGGKPAITAVVDDFIGNVAGDTRINKRFATADIPRLKTMLVNQICQASGGPCTYTGASMKGARSPTPNSTRWWRISSRASTSSKCPHRRRASSSPRLVA